MTATILIATDIFGHTPEVQALARDLTNGRDVRARVVSPYGSHNGGERPRFSSEVEAYAAFSARIGLERYTQMVAEALAEHRPALAVGFSVGATALWVALAAPPKPFTGSAVLYYGSRIRDHLDLRPAGDVRLVFAEQEASFAPAELVATLQARGMAAELRQGKAHGFMNRLSQGWDATAYAAELERLRGLLAPAGHGWLSRPDSGSDSTRR
ncbi:MAG: hydrolase [Humidesulfovibrio sp.]|uniref:hydrolase n=1 Tax=Humidesulfovibrio sp. TaxID=2910988 RepID=UPI0027EBAD95|nr:hydrolase [Humidesulfovibrio sp.]MDQ7835826.1 hydrolase [Humidesulfovibrio sp.]